MATEWKDMTEVERLLEVKTFSRDSQNGYADVDNRVYYQHVSWLLARQDGLEEQLANARSELAGLKGRLAELERTAGDRALRDGLSVTPTTQAQAGQDALGGAMTLREATGT